MQLKLADHEIGHEIANDEECHDADDKVDDITAQTGLQGHGDAGDEFQIAEGVQAQMMMPAMAKAQPCRMAYTMYSGMAQNMNMNSSGSVTPVRNTASAVEMNMDL